MIILPCLEILLNASTYLSFVFILMVVFSWIVRLMHI